MCRTCIQTYPRGLVLLLENILGIDQRLHNFSSILEVLKLQLKSCHQADLRGLGFWVWGFGFRVLGLGFRVLGSGFRVLKSHLGQNLFFHVFLGVCPIEAWESFF